eukprot:TRINITY_DN25854_c0_g1_i4.p2 TRINITY_DN25854_c0_g1~~TRINITY_DN25854_c0_g1_i4.p2  ORF type:complete len:257 (+),score=40.09 TRINITY_DN25854_c0_g1_i4:91-861(+)
MFFFFFSSRRRHTRCREVSWARRCVQETDLEVCLGGIPIGVRVNSEGVIVVGYSEIEINNVKEESPGKIGGVEIGDIIVKVNNLEINNSTDLVKIIKESEDGILNVNLIRHNKNITKIIHCRRENNEDYKIGLWVRDSTAGVGTMTFYEQNTNKFGALGHPITDCDTKNLMSIRQLIHFFLQLSEQQHHLFQYQFHQKLKLVFCLFQQIHISMITLFLIIPHPTKLFQVALKVLQDQQKQGLILHQNLVHQNFFVS